MVDNKSMNRLLKSKEYLVLSCMKRLNIYKEYEEFYQIGMIALFKALRDYKPELDVNQNIDVYAYYIILNNMRTQLRKDIRYESLCDSSDLIENQVSGVVISDDLDKRLDFEVLLRVLTADERKIVDLKLLGYQMTEISLELGLNKDQLKYKMKCIQQKLKSASDKLKVN